MAELIVDELSPEVTMTPRGNPPADDDVDMTNMGLLLSSNDDDE